MSFPNRITQEWTVRGCGGPEVQRPPGLARNPGHLFPWFIHFLFKSHLVFPPRPTCSTPSETLTRVWSLVALSRYSLRCSICAFPIGHDLSGSRQRAGDGRSHRAGRLSAGRRRRRRGCRSLLLRLRLSGSSAVFVCVCVWRGMRAACDVCGGLEWAQPEGVSAPGSTSVTSPPRTRQRQRQVRTQPLSGVWSLGGKKKKKKR